MGTTASTQDPEVENIDQTAWVPHGAEIVPAAMLLNGHAKAEGKRFVSSDTPLVDRLLESNRIDISHHETALRLIRLFRAGTSKQNYATMQIFAPSRGYDSTEFCPMTSFIRITRNLKTSQFQWIRALCGLRHCSYLDASRNADLIKEALEAVDKGMGSQTHDSIHNEESY